MKFKLATFILFLCIYGCIHAQEDRSKYLGLNISPLFVNALELGLDYTIKPNSSFNIYTGYVFNSPLNSPFKKGTQYLLTNKSGFFLKLEARHNFRKEHKRFAPFIGFNIVNSLAFEEGVTNILFDSSTSKEPIKRNSYNLGLNGILGITSPSNKKLNIDLGIQLGKLLVDNLVDFHSYMPGMGVNFIGGMRLQGIVRIKYKIN